MDDNELETIIFLKKRMLSRPLNTHSPEYVKVYKELERLCLTYCNHVCERDEIETSPDYIQIIHYCIFCECTFDT